MPGTLDLIQHTDHTAKRSKLQNIPRYLNQKL